MVELSGQLRQNLVESCGRTQWIVAVGLNRQLRWNLMDSYGRTQQKVAVGLSKQLQQSLVDNCGRTQWTVTVELSRQLQQNLVESYSGTQQIVTVEFSGIYFLRDRVVVQSSRISALFTVYISLLVLGYEGAKRLQGRFKGTNINSI